MKEKQTLKFDPEAQDPFFKGDKDYLVIVIMNIIDNAIKYSKNPSINITTENTERFLRFSIKDNGIGIDQKQLKRIFRKFFRIQNGEIYTAKGFGIGLSFVQKIVKAHGGMITVNSIPGSGSAFIIDLPLQ